MHKITLVYSGHRENGRCNVAALLEILRALEPEVVFEEMLPSDADSYYRIGTKSTLESRAIAKYRELRSFQQVPVDRYDSSVNLLVEIKTDRDRILDRVEQASQEYRELDNIRNDDVHEFGFEYLNSAAFARITARMSEIEEKVITGTGDQSLIHALERWCQALQKRELAMLGNIYQYCRENVFDTGVFLVGADHKAGIVKEIEQHAGAEVDLITWNLWV